MNFEKKQAVLKSLYESIIEVEHKNIIPSKEILVYHIILIEMSDNFKRRLIKVYVKNS